IAPATSSLPNGISRDGRPLATSGPAVEDLEYSRYFLTEWMPPLLRETAERSPPRVLADLGAGDGGTLWPLDRAGLVGETIYAVDISAKHVALCERLSPKVRGVVSDVAHVDALADGSVDAVVSSQVVEHLPDDRVLAPEIARLLRPGGRFYVASVLRGSRALGIYQGKRAARDRRADTRLPVGRSNRPQTLPLGRRAKLPRGPPVRYPALFSVTAKSARVGGASASKV